MAVSEGERRALHEGLAGVFGKEVANVLMEHLPPTGWADVATKHDVDHAVALLRAEMHAEIAGVRTEIAELGSQLRSEMLGMSTTFTHDISGLHRAINRQSHTVIAIAGVLLTGFGALTAAFH